MEKVSRGITKDPRLLLIKTASEGQNTRLCGEVVPKKNIEKRTQKDDGESEKKNE